MIEALRNRLLAPSDDEAEEHQEEEQNETGVLFGALRAVAAHLFLATGAAATLHAVQQRGDGEAASRGAEPRDGAAPLGGRFSGAAGWAPLLVGSAAAAAHLVHAFRPSEEAQTASRVLNGAAVGVGLAGLVDSAVGQYTRKRTFSAAPLVLGSTGVLGFLLDRQERETEAEMQRLERRASFVERWVPRRRTKVDKIVVHV